MKDQIRYRSLLYEQRRWEWILYSRVGQRIPVRAYRGKARGYYAELNPFIARHNRFLLHRECAALLAEYDRIVTKNVLN